MKGVNIHKQDMEIQLNRRILTVDIYDSTRNPCCHTPSMVKELVSRMEKSKEVKSRPLRVDPTKQFPLDMQLVTQLERYTNFQSITSTKEEDEMSSVIWIGVF